MLVGPRATRAAIAGGLFLYTMVWSSPVVWMAMLSLRTTDECYRAPYALPLPAHWDKFPTAWFDFGYQTYFLNSVIVSVAAVVLLIAIGSMAAFFFARYRFPLKEPLYLLIFAAIMFPPQVTLLALFQIMVTYNLYNTLLGLILVYAASHLPLTLYLLRVFFAQIPREIEEAARIDGASDWGMYWRVMFPIARPAIVTVTIINFLEFWNEFLYAVVLVNQQSQRTLPLGVMFFMGEQYSNVGMLATGLMIAALPVIILYAFAQKVMVEGLTAGSVKG